MNMSQNDTKIITRAITQYLSRREHSYCELLQKLAKKEYPKALCEQQLQLFVDKGLQSDQRFVESFVRIAYRNGKGPQFIRQSMFAHQIDEAVANDYMKTDEFDWYAAAIKVRIKRFGENQDLDFTEMQKQKRFLQYRGFEQAHINEAFN